MDLFDIRDAVISSTDFKINGEDTAQHGRSILLSYHDGFRSFDLVIEDIDHDDSGDVTVVLMELWDGVVVEKIQSCFLYTESPGTDDLSDKVVETAQLWVKGA